MKKTCTRCHIEKTGQFRADGVCQTCAIKKTQTCTRCGKEKTGRFRADGVCQTCASQKTQTCTRCGKEKTGQFRADGVCQTCAIKKTQACTRCHIEKTGQFRADGVCNSCARKKTQTCTNCGNEKTGQFRADGVCNYCADQKTQTCTSCRKEKTGQFRADGFCQPCASHKTQTCTSCRKEKTSRFGADGVCDSCGIAKRKAQNKRQADNLSPAGLSAFATPASASTLFNPFASPLSSLDGRNPKRARINSPIPNEPTVIMQPMVQSPPVARVTIKEEMVPSAWLPMLDSRILKDMLLETRTTPSGNQSTARMNCASGLITLMQHIDYYLKNNKVKKGLHAHSAPSQPHHAPVLVQHGATFACPDGTGHLYSKTPFTERWVENLSDEIVCQLNEDEVKQKQSCQAHELLKKLQDEKNSHPGSAQLIEIAWWWSDAVGHVMAAYIDNEKTIFFDPQRNIESPPFFMNAEDVVALGNSIQNRRFYIHPLMRWRTSPLTLAAVNIKEECSR